MKHEYPMDVRTIHTVWRFWLRNTWLRFAKLAPIPLLIMFSIPAAFANTGIPVPLGSGPRAYVQSSRMTFNTNLSDEFNGSSLNTKKWRSVMRSWSKDWIWVEDAVTQMNGKLILTMSLSQDAAPSYRSGIVRERTAYMYGYVEARIKAADRFPGVCTAFWAGPPDNSRTTHTEIDFLETGQHMLSPRVIDTNTHVFRMPNLKSLHLPIHEHRKYLMNKDPRNAYHVYGCAWSKTSIVWYLDGKKIAERRNTYWHQPLEITLSLGLRQPLKSTPSRKGFPTSMKVDYIRVWTSSETP